MEVEGGEVGLFEKFDYFCGIMKTILVIVSGLADVPDRMLGGKTPLMLASTPALDALARCGCCGTLRVCPEGVAPTRDNAIFALLGYDFGKGVPEVATCRPFIIPKFSGHGVVISSHIKVRRIGELALLKPIDPDRLCELGVPVLRTMADLAIQNILDHEFVMVHVESAAAMSRKRDPYGKQGAIERIDNDVIRPIADYVWNAKEQMNMVVVSDNIFPWRLGAPVEGEVPAVVYFNDDLPYNTPRFDEKTLEEGPLNAPLPGDLIKLLISFEPVCDDMI